jgi:hypothetical protein
MRTAEALTGGWSPRTARGVPAQGASAAEQDENSELARLLLMSRQPTQALALSKAALTAHDKARRSHAWTKESASVTSDALDALGRAEEAKGPAAAVWGTEAEKPKAS